jgi:predicted transcriptional regulator
MPGGEKNDDVRLQAAAMIVAGMPYDAITERVGVSRRTLSRWMGEDPEFQEILGELRAEVLNKLSGELAQHLGKARETLVKAMDSPVIHASVRAAVELINLYFRSVENGEMRERITRLELTLADEEEGVYR